MFLEVDDGSLEEKVLIIIVQEYTEPQWSYMTVHPQLEAVWDREIPCQSRAQVSQSGAARARRPP